MKKRIAFMIIAVIAALSCALAIPTAANTANAATVTTETTQGVVLTYEVASAFTVTIPEDVTLTNGTGTGTVSVANSVIPYNHKLNVSITAATNYLDAEGETPASFRLKDEASTNYINYTITKEGSEVAKDADFLSVAAGTATGSSTLTYTASAPTIAGTYSDSLTFNVAVEAA